RLKRSLSLEAQARPLGELLAELTRELALPLEADRDVADDKVSLFFREQPAGEMLALLAEKLGYHWVARAGGYQLQQNLAWWQAAAAEEARAQETARRQLAEMTRLYEAHLEKDPETLERIREQARHDLGRETDPARRHQLRVLRRVAGDLTEPAVRVFLNVYRSLPEEARAALTAGRTASIRVDAKGPADEPITYEVQVRQVVEGRRAALVFRAPEAVYPDGDPAPRVVMEWRLETLPLPEERPAADAGDRALEGGGRNGRLKAGADSHTSEGTERRTPVLHAAVPRALLARRITITLKGSARPKTPGIPLEPVLVERVARGRAVVVGEKTAGCIGSTIPGGLLDGSALYVTLFEYVLGPDDLRLHRIGVTPNIPVEPPTEVEEELGIDPQLDAALDVIRQLTLDPVMNIPAPLPSMRAGLVVAF
ncbi:MAG: hypothetical protein K6U89_19805, partial [Chloroflexi bacterium]|nr:hypothetical protein [Chloroflexota bacterium]